MRDDLTSAPDHLFEANRRLRIEISERELVEEALRLSRNRLKLLNEIAFFDGDGLSVDEIVEQAQASERPSFGNDSWLDVSPSYLEAVLRGDSLVLEDASIDVVRHGALIGGSAWHVGALMGVPVRRNEKLYGLVGFAASGMRRWTDHELTVVRELAGYLSMVRRKA
jgi:GAF domain-containing protein